MTDSESDCDTELVTSMSDIEEEGGSKDRNEATKSDETAVNEETPVALADLAIDYIVPEKRRNYLKLDCFSQKFLQKCCWYEAKASLSV